MPGAGFQPAGTTAAGLGHAAGIPLPGQAYESTADLVASRKIDPVARDYVVNDDDAASPHDEMDPVDQEVLLRLTTRRGQLAMDRAYGNDLLNATKDNGDLQRFAERTVETCLAALIEARSIRIISILGVREGSALVALVNYENTLRKTNAQVRAAL